MVDSCYYYIPHLAVIRVTGADAGVFLQGQLTCNINQLNDDTASFAAYCNAKGRVITPMLVVRQADDFALIVPSSLVDKVIAKLKLYILRSKVQLVDCRQTFTIHGLSGQNPGSLSLPQQPLQVFQGDYAVLRLPTALPRYLLLLPSHQDSEFRERWQQLGYQSSYADNWRYLDIVAAIPWFDLAQSEAYIPQMLNLEQLGAISYNKGCYTGQEIIARTHYLGQNKRSLYLAQAETELGDECLDHSVLDADSHQKLGDVLIKQNHDGKAYLLLVLQTVASPGNNPILSDSAATVLKLVTPAND